MRRGNRNKMGAKKTTVDGIVFDSIKESRRYKALKLLQRAGEITDLELQPSFELILKVTYTADFRYRDRLTGTQVVEDVKGFRTREYIRNRKAMRLQHGIVIKET